MITLRQGGTVSVEEFNYNRKNPMKNWMFNRSNESSTYYQDSYWHQRVEVQDINYYEQPPTDMGAGNLSGWKVDFSSKRPHNSEWRKNRTHECQFFKRRSYDEQQSTATIKLSNKYQRIDINARVHIVKPTSIRYYKVMPPSCSFGCEGLVFRLTRPRIQDIQSQ